MKIVIKEFLEFIKEYNIVSLAVAFIMGAASNSLVRSLVNDIIMPLISPLLPGETWQEAVWTLGSIQIRWGSFLSELLHFLILAFIVFLIVKKLIRQFKKEK